MPSTIDASVFEQLGRTIFHAQILEKTLVSENLALDPHAEKLDPAAVAALDEKLQKKNLSQLLTEWQSKVPSNKSLFEYLSDVREDRNLLALR